MHEENSRKFDRKFTKWRKSELDEVRLKIHKMKKIRTIESKQPISLEKPVSNCRMGARNRNIQSSLYHVSNYRMGALCIWRIISDNIYSHILCDPVYSCDLTGSQLPVSCMFGFLCLRFKGLAAPINMTVKRCALCLVTLCPWPLAEFMRQLFSWESESRAGTMATVSFGTLQRKNIRPYRQWPTP